MGRLEYLRDYRPIMNDESAEVTRSQVIPDMQRRAIVGLADIRRGSQALGVELDTLTKSSAFVDLAEPIKAAFEDQRTLVIQATQGVPPIEQEGGPRESIIASHLEKAAQFKDISPQIAALHFAKAAALEQAAKLSYSKNLENAKESLDISGRQGIARSTPGDFLPNAIVLGIAKKAAEGIELPSPQIVAEAIQQGDSSLLKDYALVLSEGQRDEFLAAFPKNKRAELSLQLDRAVSTVLNKRLITKTVDLAQRDAIFMRVQEAFSGALQTLKSSGNPDIPTPEGRGIGSRWSIKQITETLVNLGEDDSLRLLRDLSEGTTVELKSLNRKLRKMPDSERAKALQPFTSFTGRVLDTLIAADVRRGGVLTMRYLEMTVLPNHLFTFFARKLINQDYFTKNLAPFLENNNIPVLKRVMGRYGPQFNTIIDTLTQTPDYAADHQLTPHESELFAALADLDTLTPRIFNRYRQLPPEQKKVFAEQIRQLKPQFFRNVPIKGILPSSERDILAEMVYMAYKPMAMSFESVEQLIVRVDDHTDDIARYTFPEEGYPLSLERQGRYVVKEKEQVDLTAFREYRNMFTPAEIRESDGNATPLSQAFRVLLLRGNQDEMIRALLLPFQNEPRIQEFLQRYTDLTLDTAYNMGNELVEIMGVYFRDNYAQDLTSYLTDHPAEAHELLSLFSDQGTRSIIGEKIKEYDLEFDWQNFDRLVQPSASSGLFGRFFSRFSSTEENPQALVAGLLANLIEREGAEPILKRVKNELSKFVLQSGESTTVSRGALKAYISKNVGSFFAKSAAGICTAEDIPLFEREDHFHINVVENDEAVRANIQAYVTSINGRPSLLLRGFNPTPDWIGKIDVEGFCEQILAIGKEFQRANGLGGVYITEQGGWHALSNRDQVARYLMQKYEEGKSGIPLKFPVASSHDIQRVYDVT